MTETINVSGQISEKSLGVWSLFMGKIKKQKDNEKEEFKKSLEKAREEFNTAINNYEFADTPELVDYYTYNIKAAQTKYEYLLKK